MTSAITRSRPLNGWAKRKREALIAQGISPGFARMIAREQLNRRMKRLGEKYDDDRDC